MKCVYCLRNRELRDEQILVRAENLYICAPRGQLVEGYLAIAPYCCIGCLARMPADWFAELTELKATVTDFYANAYGIARPTFYEQGRGGGGALADEVAGFPLHAHLCCLPLTIDLHAGLARDYRQKPLSGPEELATVVGNEAYLYIDSAGQRFAYVGRSPEAHRELAAMRLKPTIAALVGFPERGYWRAYPGDRELEDLVERWRRAWPS